MSAVQKHDQATLEIIRGRLRSLMLGQAGWTIATDCYQGDVGFLLQVIGYLDAAIQRKDEALRIAAKALETFATVTADKALEDISALSPS